MPQRKKKIPQTPLTGSEEVAPGATRQAIERPENPDQTAPPPDDRPASGEEAEAYAGPAGGAVGGTPAGLRSKGGQTHAGLNPGGERHGESTVGAEAERE